MHYTVRDTSRKSCGRNGRVHENKILPSTFSDVAHGRLGYPQGEILSNRPRARDDLSSDCARSQ